MSSITIISHDTHKGPHSEDTKKAIIDQLVRALYFDSGTQSSICSRHIVFDLPVEHYEMQVKFMFDFMTSAAEQVISRLPKSFVEVAECNHYFIGCLEHMRRLVLAQCGVPDGVGSDQDYVYKVYLIFERDLELIGRLGIARVPPGADESSLVKQSIVSTRLVLAKSRKS